jgi:glycyl-tRNA synthetase beta subunit
MRTELRKLKQAYETLSSNKDKEVSALRAVKDFLWNQLRTMCKDSATPVKIKEVEAAQANEAAQKLQQNVEELQVTARRFQAEAVTAKKRVLILEGKLLEMHSSAKEKNDEIRVIKNGQPQPQSLKCKCASSVSNVSV